MSTSETPIRDEMAVYLCDPSGEIAINGSPKDRLALGKCLESVGQIERKLTAAKAEVEEIRQKLKDPHAVRINLLYGHIAKPDDLIFMHDEGGPYNLLLKSRDAWKKMAGDIMDQLDSWSNLHPNHVTSGDVEVKAAYEKLLKEDA